MCGIVGYTGPRSAVPLVLEGLKKLEYRGYDSAGIAVLDPGGELQLIRSVGKLVSLEERVNGRSLEGRCGLGHTRWATHGGVTEQNAHPHRSCDEAVVVVHNGIVENYRQLRAELRARGHTFRSETDTENIPHLIEEGLREGLPFPEAFRRACLRLEGAHAIAALYREEPQVLVAARIGNAGGVVVGLGEEETWLASDSLALLAHTRTVVFLDDGEMAVLRPGEARFYRIEDGAEIEKAPVQIPWDPVLAVKGPYRHFMQKEIYEQAEVLSYAFRGRIDFNTGEVTLPESLPDPQALERIVITACGTAWHAGLVGKFFLERLARVPVEVDYASELRYRDPVWTPGTWLVAVTQSGETVDTLEAMALAKRAGVPLIGVVNVIGSQATRVADTTLYIHAGPEIGVASTKAFTNQIATLLLLALWLGQERGTLDRERQRILAQGMAELPAQIGRLLEVEEPYRELAPRLAAAQSALYIGRGINYPIALEGALKLKEISYIHAEGYPAGEMKHGPIALIDERFPVVAIAVRDPLREKMISQIEQAKARGGEVIAVATEGDELVAEKADHVLWVPETDPLLTPFLTVVPLQRLAYEVAVWRGADVDQPRNLAKSVTVE